MVAEALLPITYLNSNDILSTYNLNLNTDIIEMCLLTGHILLCLEEVRYFENNTDMIRHFELLTATVIN